MGKGLIQSDDGRGSYTVLFDYGTADRDAIVADLDTTITETQAKVDEVQALYDSFAVEIPTFQSNLDAAVDNYIAEKTDDNIAAVKKATADLNKIFENQRRTLSILNGLKLRLANAEKKRDTLQSLVLTETKSVWCADRTEGASGEVATIEINGEQPLALIKPSAPGHTPDDGLMFARDIQTAAGVYYNAALLPGWQKFSPTYRTGNITYIDRENNLCDVNIDPATSSAQGLDINQTNREINVPIEYMTCNHAAFSVGDEVVIQFEGQDWDSPKVIGFKENPKLCGYDSLYFPMFFYNEQILQEESTDPERALGVPITEERYDDGTKLGYYNGLFSTPVGRPETTSGSVPVPYGVRIVDMMLRFDRGWYREERDVGLWKAGFFNEQTNGEFYRIKTAQSLGFRALNPNTYEQSIEITVRDLTAKSEEIEINGEPWTVWWAEGTFLRDWYSFGAASAITLEPAAVDKAHLDNWMRVNMCDNLPEVISIYQDPEGLGNGAWIEYELDHVGQYPWPHENKNAERQYPYVEDPEVVAEGGSPEGTGGVYWDRRCSDTMGVTYRRKGTDPLV